MLRIEDHGAVREIRLARPPANAFDEAMLRAIDAALVDACQANARALVLSGQPGMFSGGLDVPGLLRLDRTQMKGFWNAFFGVQARLASLPLPIVAAITGHSPAGGAVLACYCDLRIMADGKYRIGLNEVQVGLFPGPVVYGVVRRVVGPREAERLMCSGLLLLPTEALRAGLVDRVLPAAEVIPAAIEWAQTMAALPPKALAATRSLARADLVALLSGIDADAYESMNDAWFSEETQATMRKLTARLKK